MSRRPTEERQRQITDAALKIIAEQGLGRFTTAAIASEVGISDGTIFRHFDSKEAIVLAVMDRVEQELFADFPPLGDDPLERLGRFVDQRARLIVRQPVIARLVFSDQLRYAAGDAGVEKVRSWKLRSLGFIQECLTEAAGAGLLRAGVKPAELVPIVHGALVSLAMIADLGPARGLLARTEGLWSTVERLIRRSE